MRGLQAVTTITKMIVLIHSEPRMREVLKDCLVHLGGWQVLGVDSPLQGLEKAFYLQPDAIVFDISTFGMNFFTFLKRLREQPDTQLIPVVLIASGAKWFSLQNIQEFQSVWVIDDLFDPTRIPKQIAKFLDWDEEPTRMEIDDSDFIPDSQ